MLVYARGTGYDEEIVERLLLVAERARKIAGGTESMEAAQ